MIVLDASVLIAHLEDTDAHHRRATELLTAVADEPFAASALTLAEVLVGPARAHQLERATAALAQLEVSTIDVSSDSPGRLAALRAETGLKLPDCCVVLAAETAHATIATFDERLAAAARRLGFRVRDA